MSFMVIGQDTTSPGLNKKAGCGKEKTEKIEKKIEKVLRNGGNIEKRSISYSSDMMMCL